MKRINWWPFGTGERAARFIPPRLSTTSLGSFALGLGDVTIATANGFIDFRLRLLTDNALLVAAEHLEDAPDQVRRA